MAHKKSGGSSTNGRESAGRRLGFKCCQGQEVLIGNIIVRQRGMNICPGMNVKMGKDHTLYAVAEGIVDIRRKHNKLYANVIKAL